jgi:hypothetical protein
MDNSNIFKSYISTNKTNCLHLNRDLPFSIKSKTFPLFLGHSNCTVEIIVFEPDIKEKF